jgi:ribosome-binding protein aMBF1 (putative translation factor)
MFVYTEESAAPQLSPWGLEVKHKLLDHGMSQKKLIAALGEKKILINKVTLSHLLKRIGTPAHLDAIHAINEILEIPEAE